MKDNWVKVGYIANTHGIAGQMKVQSLSDVPDRLLTLKSAYIGKEKTPVRIQSAKEHKGMTLLQFEGIDNINDCLQWKGDYLYVEESERGELPEGSWFIHDLIGLVAVDEKTGERIGEVSDYLETFANGVLVIQKEEGNEALVPFVDAFVGEVDLSLRTVQVTLIEGM